MVGAPLQTSQMRWPKSLPALTPSLTLRRQNRQWCRLENIPNGCLVMKQFGAISHPSARCSESSLNLPGATRQDRLSTAQSHRLRMENGQCRARVCAALTCQGCPTETDRFCCAWSGRLQHEAVVKSRQPASFRWQGEADCHLRGMTAIRFESRASAKTFLARKDNAIELLLLLLLLLP